MLSWIREKFGTVIIGGIISLIAFVFIFYGVFSPRRTRGLHEGAVAGTVNGDPIPINEFNRELNRRLEFFKSLGAGNITDEQLKAFRVKEGVFQELAQRKMLTQEALRQGLIASDSEVMDKVKEIPAFQKDGKFDFLTYKQVLQANHQTPGSFEKLVREDISVQKWGQYFKDRIRVSEEEVKREFLMSQDKRKIKYVLLTPDNAKKKISVSDEDVKKFLADKAKMNLVKLKFEEGKEGPYKGQTLEKVQNTIAKNILAGEKLEDIQKINQGLATEVLSLMTSGGGDQKVAAYLKPVGGELKTTEFISREKNYIQGIGEASEMMRDAFAAQSPIDLKKGGKVKKYILADRILIAGVVDSQVADLKKLETDRETLIRQIAGKKFQSVYQDWMKKLTTKAKIDMNPSVVGAEEQ